MKITKIISVFLVVAMLAFIMVSLTGCGEKEANKINSNNETTEQPIEAQEAENKNNSDKLKITVLDQNVTMPFNLSVILNAGYEFSSDEEKAQAQSGSIYDGYHITFYKDGSLISAHIHSEGSLDTATVTALQIIYPDTDSVKVNGFAKGDKTSDLIKSLDSDHEIISGSDDSIDKGRYIADYLFEDTSITVYSTDGVIDTIFVTFEGKTMN